MSKINKGETGYITYRLKIQGIKTLIGACIIIGLIIAGLIINDGNKNNYYTLAAICLVMPVAKIAVSMFMYFIHRNISSKDEYEQLTATKTKGLLVSDTVVTVNDKVYPVEFAVITDSGVCCYTKSDKVKPEDLCNGIQKFIHSCGYEVNVTVLKDFRKFKDRVAGLKSIEMDIEKAADVRHSFLIMCL